MPGLERIRLDADTASRPGALREALERFAAARAAALIGTQMVAKGHHFPGVSIAAVVDADAGLAFPDFRAEERTFQLVTQLAGRSGRDAPGQGDRPDLPAGRDAVRVRGAARRRGLPRARARAPRGARLPAISQSCFTRRLGTGAGGAAARARGAARRARRAWRRAARAGAAAPAAWALSRSAAREDDVSAGVRAQAAALLAAAAPAMRRDGLTAVVDVDPQSL